MSWIQRGNTIQGLTAIAEFGTSLDVTPDGMTMIVGGPNDIGGEVRVFDWNGATWNQRGIPLVGNAATPQAGVAVTISEDGNRIAYGITTGANDEVPIYEWNGTAWALLGTPITSATGQGFGVTLSLNPSGDTITIGVPMSAGAGTIGGETRQHRYDGVGWPSIGSSAGFGTDMIGSKVKITGNDASSPIPAGGNVYFESRVTGNPATGIWQYDTPSSLTRSFLGGLDRFQVGDSFGLSGDMNANGTSIIVGARSFGANQGRVAVYDWNGLAPGAGSDYIERGGVGVSTFTGTVTGERLGEDVAMSADGNTIAMSSIQNNNSYVKIFKWTGNVWVEVARINGTVFNEEFGYQVALANNGKTLFATSPERGANGQGSVRVYDIFEAIIEQIGLDLTGFGGLNGTGYSVDINDDGSRIIVGVPNGTTGQVDIYEWDGTSWILGNSFSGNGSILSYGLAVAMSGDGSTIAYGTVDNGTNTIIEVREWNGINWVPKGDSLTAFTFPAFTSGTMLGTALALNYDGTIITFGSPQDGLNNNGQVITYILIGGAWTVRNAGTVGLDDAFLGTSVAISGNGDIRAFGSPGTPGIVASYVSIGDWNGTPTGSVGSYAPIGVVTGSHIGDDFGRSIALSQDGTTLVVGAPEFDPSMTPGGQHGMVAVYDYIGASTWSIRGSVIIGSAGYQLGYSVDVNADGSVISYSAHGIDTVFYREWISGASGAEWAIVATVSGTSGSEFGFSNRMNRSGNRVIIGAPNDSAGVGLAQVYSITREFTNQDVLRYVSTNDGVKIARVGNDLYRITNKISTYSGLYFTLFASLGLSPDDARDLYDRTVFPSPSSQYGGDVTGLIGSIITDVSNNDPDITIFATAKNQWSFVAEVNGTALEALGTQGVATADMRVVVVLGQNGANYEARTYLYNNNTQSYDEATGGAILLNTNYNTAKYFKNVDITSSSEDGELRIVVSSLNSGPIGEVKVYQFSYGTESWTDITSNLLPIMFPNADGFGYIVAISGDGNTVSVGTGPGDPTHDPQIQSFRYNGATWGNIDNFVFGSGSLPLDFGYGLDLSYDGKLMVVGNPKFSTAVGGILTRFLPDTGPVGGPTVSGDIVGFGSVSGFGQFVSLSADGRRVLVGSATSAAANQSGRVAVLEFNGVTWNTVHSSIDGERGLTINSNGRISGDGKRIFLSATTTSFSGITTGLCEGVVVYEDTGIAWVKLANSFCPTPTSTLPGFPTYTPYPSYTGKRVLLPARIQEPVGGSGFDVFTLGPGPEALPNFYDVSVGPGQATGNFITDSGIGTDTGLTNVALSVNEVNSIPFASHMNTAQPGYTKEYFIEFVGTLYFNSDGSFLFVRNIPTFVEGEFTYSVTDGTDVSNTAIITFIQLSSIPSLNTPNSISITTNIGSANFTATNTTGTLTTAGGIPPLTYGIQSVIPVGNTSTLVDPTGTLIVTGDNGDYTFTPDPTHDTTGVTNITVQVTDSALNVSTAILTITYTANPALTLPNIPDTMISYAIGGAFAPDPVPGVSWPESGGSGPPLTYTVMPPSGVYGDILFAGNPMAQYQPRTTGLMPLPIIPGNYTDTFIFQVQDVTGDMASTTYDIQITVTAGLGLAAPPVGTIARNQNSALTSESNTSGTLSAVGGINPLAFSIQGGTLNAGVYTDIGMYGTLTVTEATGVYAYTLGALNIPGPYTDTFTVEVTDGASNTDFQLLMIMITINNVLVLPAPPTATISSAINSAMPPVTSNGTGTLVATGGTTPITYEFSSGVTIPGPGVNELDQVQTEVRLRLNTVTGAYSVIPQTLPTIANTYPRTFPIGTIDATGAQDSPGLNVNIIIYPELVLAGPLPTGQISKTIDDTIPPPVATNLTGTLMRTGGVPPTIFSISGTTTTPFPNFVQQMKMYGTLLLNTINGSYVYTIGMPPNVQGTYNDDFTLNVTDAQGNIKSRLYRVTYTVGPTFTVITPSNGSVIKQIGNPNLTVFDLTGNISASGGKTPYTYAVNGSNIGNYGTLTINPSTGAYSYGNFNIQNMVLSDTDAFTINVTDNDGRVVSTTLTIDITVTSGIMLMRPTNGKIIKSVRGTSVTQTGLTGTLMPAGAGPPFTYSIRGGFSVGPNQVAFGQHGNLRVTISTGAYVYTPNPLPDVEDRFSDTFTLILVDGAGATATTQYRVDFEINPQLLVDRPNPSRGSITRNITQMGFEAVGLTGKFSPRGGVPPYTFEIQGGADSGNFSELTGTLGRLRINKITGEYQFLDPIVPNVPGNISNLFIILVRDQNGEIQMLDYVAQITVKNISLDLLPVFTDVQNRSAIRYWNFVIHLGAASQLTRFFENTEILVIGQTDPNPGDEARDIDAILRQLLLAAIETTEIGKGGEDVLTNIRNNTKDVLDTADRSGILTYSFRFTRKLASNREIERVIELADILSTSHKNFLLNRYRSNIGEGLVVFYFDDSPQSVIDLIFTQIDILSRIGIGGVILVQIATRLNRDPGGNGNQNVAYARELGAKQSEFITRLTNLRTINQILSVSIRYDRKSKRYQNVGVRTVVEVGESRVPEQLEYALPGLQSGIQSQTLFEAISSLPQFLRDTAFPQTDLRIVITEVDRMMDQAKGIVLYSRLNSLDTTGNFISSRPLPPTQTANRVLKARISFPVVEENQLQQVLISRTPGSAARPRDLQPGDVLYNEAYRYAQPTQIILLISTVSGVNIPNAVGENIYLQIDDGVRFPNNPVFPGEILSIDQRFDSNNLQPMGPSTSIDFGFDYQLRVRLPTTPGQLDTFRAASLEEYTQFPRLGFVTIYFGRESEAPVGIGPYARGAVIDMAR